MTRRFTVIPNAQDIPGNALTPYVYGRVAVNVDTWLENEAIPSNKTGVPFFLLNGELDQIWVGNELLSDFDITVYHHLGDELSLTSLVTVNIPNTSRTASFTPTDIGTISIPQNVQIAVRVTAITGTPNPKNLKVYLIPRGDTPL